MSDSTTPNTSAKEPSHPLDDIAGMFEDEPLWDDLMEEIRKNRERDAKIPVPISRTPRRKLTKQALSTK
ncbi:hypothetical protein [Armatimonas sp.]|uniref:hypothetical protein n=1 Tax=Armatimonas sp. TaxID=1872638 RepID=UPI00286AB4AC|nr:hypothetical protein [Armatimonas sp.]